MNFDWRKLDLRKANIFDLTDDIELIHQCTCRRWIESVDDRDEYVHNTGKINIARAMITFARLVNDDELHTKLEKIFSKEIEEYMTPTEGAGWE